MELILIVIADYGMGNLRSVSKACERFADDVVVSSKKDDMVTADKIILPGVGAFGKASDNLNKFGLFDAIDKEVKHGKLFLGICLGLQLVFDGSDENPNKKGFGWIKGTVKKFTKARKVPQIGWNSIEWKKETGITEGIPQNEYFYFVHSYYAPLCDYSIGITEYEGEKFTSLIQKDNIIAAQFHPEKSHNYGLKLLENFIKI